MSYIEWLRSRVGRRKVILTFASVILRDASGRLLLQRRGDFDAWGLPGGVVEIGEDIRTCAHRELLEETGLTAGDLELVGVYSEPEYDSVYPNGDQAQQYSVCFQGQAQGGELRADGIESRAVKFYNPGEIPLAEILPWYRAMIDDALGADLPAFTGPVTRQDLTPQIEYMRSLLGDEPFIAAGATAVTVREDGCLLVVQHRGSGEWSTPTDYLNLGENAAHTAQRVTLSEAGLQVEPQRILDVFSPVETWPDSARGQVQPVITIISCRVAGGNINSSASNPIQATWIPVEKLLAMPTRPSLLELHLTLGRHIQ
jgi:ADP-ribose pyrophosphatase YjhB (NUDIX family)